MPNTLSPISQSQCWESGKTDPGIVDLDPDPDHSQTLTKCSLFNGLPSLKFCGHSSKLSRVILFNCLKSVKIHRWSTPGSESILKSNWLILDLSFHKLWFKCVNYFSSNPANKDTDKQTDRQIDRQLTFATSLTEVQVTSDLYDIVIWRMPCHSLPVERRWETTVSFQLCLVLRPWASITIQVQHWGDHWSRRQGRTPKAWESRGCGVWGGGFPTGEASVRDSSPPQKISRLRISKWWVLTHSVRFLKV